MNIRIEEGIAVLPLADKRIRRYYPHCAVAAAEIACLHMHDSPRFDFIYGYHTFELSAQDPVVHIAEGSGECNYSFSRESWINSAVWEEMSQWYGIVRGHRPVRALAEVVEGVKSSLATGIPLVIDFDLGFLRGRKEYGRIFSKHVVCIIGIDEANRKVTALEQIQGLIEIDFSDLEKCITRHQEVHGAYNILRFSKLDVSMDPLERAKARIRANLGNLESATPDRGLKALAAFRAVFSQTLALSESASAPFYIPGAWTFSHERYAQPFFVAGICKRFGINLKSPYHKDFDVLHRAWLMVDGAMETNYASYDKENGARIAKYLPIISDYEARLVGMWHELLQALEAKP